MIGENIELRVGDMLYAIKKKWRMILIFTVAGLLAGIILSGASYLQGSMTKNYEVVSSAVFITQNKKGVYSEGREDISLNDVRMAKEMIDTVRFVLKSKNTLKEVIEKAELIGISEGDISSNLRVTQQGDTPVLLFSLTWRNSTEGIKIVETLLDVSTKYLQDSLETGRLSVVEEPSAKYIVGGKLNIPIWGVMAAFGLFLGLGFTVLEIIVKPTLINLKDVMADFGMETIGVVEKNESFFQSKKLKEAQIGPGGFSIKQDFSAAAYILRNRLGKSDHAHVLYVTSAKRGEGRTSVAANLALELSEMNHKVLLADFDTNNPNIGPMFVDDVDFEHSLNALYRGKINENEAIVPVNAHLDILPVVFEHNPIPIDSMVLDMIKNLSGKYEYIIMDTPPVGEYSNTLSLNPISDSAVLVIGYDMATKQEIAETIERMDKSGVKIIGAIVNKDQSIAPKS